MDATSYVPGGASLAQLRRAAADYRGCPLHERATQTVFGEGDPGAEIVLVGETPGNQEDQAGRSFVGPAGRELDRALDSDLAEIVMITIHPSAILRARTDMDRYA